MKGKQINIIPPRQNQLYNYGYMTKIQTKIKTTQDCKKQTLTSNQKSTKIKQGASKTETEPMSWDISSRTPLQQFETKVVEHQLTVVVSVQPHLHNTW